MGIEDTGATRQPMQHSSQETPNYNAGTNIRDNAADTEGATSQIASSARGYVSRRSGYQASTAPSSGPFDSSTTIKGMYRILDLISEQSSGGLGEEIQLYS